MSKMSLNICHMYPDVLNLYGDRGNVICLQKRLQWRWINCSITSLPVGSRANLNDFDLFFIGGGQDFEQQVLQEDLRSSGKDKEIVAAANDGKVFFCVCGGYQMMGHYYKTQQGAQIDYLGACDFYTEAGAKRMIGNIAFEFDVAAGSGGNASADADENATAGRRANLVPVVGFENHSGKTYLGAGVQPLGRVLSGFGNNGEDGGEGVRDKNVFGTYAHGPVLPKNPALADAVLQCALEHKYGDAAIVLEPLDNSIELAARDDVLKNIMHLN